MHLSIYSFIYSFIYLFHSIHIYNICLFMYLFIYLFTSFYIYLYMYAFIHIILCVYIYIMNMHTQWKREREFWSSTKLRSSWNCDNLGFNHLEFDTQKLRMHLELGLESPGISWNHFWQRPGRHVSAGAWFAYIRSTRAKSMFYGTAPSRSKPD